MRYLLEASQSRFTVQAFARGALSALGHSPTFAIRSFTGEVSFADETGAAASINLTIQADSLALTDSLTTKDREEIESRMRQEVLDTAACPEIVFRSTEIAPSKIAEGWYRLGISGNLALHGVTNAHRVEAQLRLREEEVRLSGEGTLLQSAYRIKPVTALAGMIRLQDPLKLSFELVGRKKP